VFRQGYDSIYDAARAVEAGLDWQGGLLLAEGKLLASSSAGDREEQ